MTFRFTRFIIPAILAILTLTTFSLAQTFTKLADFDGTDGANSAAAMTQALDGNLYGTTNGGGINNGGVIFQFNPSGSPIATYNFCRVPSCPIGNFPMDALILGRGGALYGTGQGGGATGGGTVFRSINGHPQVIYSFCLQSGCPDGENIYAGLVEARDGNFYGGAYNGGAYGYGSIFRITASGQLTVLYSFCAQSGCPDGAAVPASLIQASNGYLYGVTAYGGPNDGGTIFRITPSGTLTTLYSFCAKTNCVDGQHPEAKLVQASNGILYGTTSQGGANSGGTVFQITPSGAFKKIYDFCSQGACTDGYAPFSDLIQATDGNLYGVTTLGGSNNNYGTIFQITTSGVLTTLHRFDNTDGASPNALVQFTDGNLYGTTAIGGLISTCKPNIGGCGTVYSLSMGLNPFVKLLWPWGKVGSSTVIYGTNLSGATRVTFNGLSAFFTVISPTEISATVPGGATTGTVHVTTNSGILNSNSMFRIVP
jgi:uncharacterized repeat protein (TIGR03803 family)